MTDRLPKGIEGYPALWERIRGMGPAEAHEALRWLCLNDLYFLVRYVLRRGDIEHPWVFARAREVQAEPDGWMDLWARGHFKSTLRTFGQTIQEILRNPELTVCILSFNRPTAVAFLNQIKTELEQNEQLKELFPEILWGDPAKESPKWSSYEGLRVKRKSNPKENTVEAWGLIDAMPTGRHFRLIIYDDVVTLDACATPDAMKKVTRAWEMSDNLGSGDGTRYWYIGTRYKITDTWGDILARGVVRERRHAAEDANGVPVLLSKETLEEKRRKMGRYVFACQMMQNPVAEGQQAFLPEWLKYYQGEPDRWAQGANVYVVVDPATSEKEGSDYTSMWVVALRGDQNYYVVDGIRKNLSLTGRGEWLMKLVRKWKPVRVGYEEYGFMKADTDYMRDLMTREKYHFVIEPLKGGKGKTERILKLVPLFEFGRIHLPAAGAVSGHFAEAVEGLVQQEYLRFPDCANDDSLDNLANIVHPSLNAYFPKAGSGTAGAQAPGNVVTMDYSPLANMRREMMRRRNSRGF